MDSLKQLLAQLRVEPQPERPYRHPSQYRVIEGQRQYSDGMTKLYQPNWLTVAVATVTLGLYIGVAHIILALFIGGFWYRWLWGVLAGLFATLSIPCSPRRLASVTHSWLFLTWRRYFHFSYMFEENLDAYRDYVIAQFPHGAFPIAHLMGGTFMATEYPEYNVNALAAHSAFLVPIWRHVHSWLGTASCTRNNFHRLMACGVNGPLAHERKHSSKPLNDQAQSDSEASSREGGSNRSSSRSKAQPAALRKQAAKQSSKQAQQQQQVAGGSSSSSSSSSSFLQRLFNPIPWQQELESQEARDDWNYGLNGPSKKRTGISVGVMVGGIAEMFMLRPDREQIKLKDRKGFVRIAIEHGSDILPVYVFGSSACLDFGPPWLQRWSRKWRISLGIMYGLWGLPIPRRVPLFMAVGKPVPVPRGMGRHHPEFEAAVDKVHADVCAAMERVYYTHRAKYGHGYENRPLVIC